MTNTMYTRSNRQSVFYSFILLLISLSFVISDWQIYNLSMGIFFAMTAFIAVLFGGKVKVGITDSVAAGIPLALLALASLLTYLFNDYWLNLRIVMISSAIFIFLLMTTVIFVRFIIQYDLKEKLLLINNVLAVFLIVLGVLITLSIYNDDFTLARFVWTFTRQDYQSYFFGGNSDIVRTRSVFSEPAHMGFYLNSLFFANLQFKVKKQLLFLPIITLGILTTLSYSMILIHGLLIVVYLGRYIAKHQINWKWSYLLLSLPLIFAVIYFREFLYETMIVRSINIISGEDGSAYNRIIESWMYVDRRRIWFGNGIGHTPPVTNNYAYALSEFGLVGFVPFVVFSFYVSKKSMLAGILFIAMNFSRGGYLTPAFWIFVLIIMIYSDQKDQPYSNGKEYINVRHVSNTG